MRFIRRLVIATAEWVSLLSVVVITWGGAVFGNIVAQRPAAQWALTNVNLVDTTTLRTVHTSIGWLGYLVGGFIGFVIAATLVGTFFALVEIAHNTRPRRQPIDHTRPRAEPPLLQAVQTR